MLFRRSYVNGVLYEVWELQDRVELLKRDWRSWVLDQAMTDWI
jgi:hypothetical protein